LLGAARGVAQLSDADPAASKHSHVDDPDRCPSCHQPVPDRELPWYPPRDALAEHKPRRVGVHTPPTTENWKKMTFYMRELPTDICVPFSSPGGRQIFVEALADGTAESFFKLIEQFHTQDEPAYCGLASLAMVLNALAIDPRRPWKGPWRWFSEDLLDCCEPLERIREHGIAMGKLACLARCNGAQAEAVLQSTTTLEQFRREVEEACSQGNPHLIVSYSRQGVRQTGDGHYSPLGAYNRTRDMALVLDVARFKYPPHWVSLPLLFEAMGRTDPDTGLTRGYIKLTKAPGESLAFTVDVKNRGWVDGYRLVAETLPSMVAASEHGEARDLVGDLLLSLPPRGLSFITLRMSHGGGGTGARGKGVCGDSGCDERTGAGAEAGPQAEPLSTLDVPPCRENCAVPGHQRAFLLQELRCMPLFAMVRDEVARQHRRGVRHGVVGGAGPGGASVREAADAGVGSAAGMAPLESDVCAELEAERLTMLLLMAGRDAWGAAQSAVVREEMSRLCDLRPAGLSLVRTEVAYLQRQLSEITRMGGSDGVWGSPGATSAAD